MSNMNSHDIYIIDKHPYLFSKRGKDIRLKDVDVYLSGGDTLILTSCLNNG